MKIISFLFLIARGFYMPLFAAAVESSPKEDVRAEDVYCGYILMAKQEAADKSLALTSPAVAGACTFFNGQNIQNACDVDYVKTFFEKGCSVETLYGLYLALKGFFDVVTDSFVTEDLNRGLSHYNFNFLKAVFDERDSS